MVRTIKNPMNRVACLGLALGEAYGIAGSTVAVANPRAAFWRLDAVAILTAAFILSSNCVREGNHDLPP
jgi:hypothetical protein